MKQTIVALCASLVLLPGVQLFAHHSFTAAYDASKRIEVEGVVKEFIWRNPHSFVKVEVTTKAGATETWNLEWGSSTQLTAAKFPVTRTTLKFGDRIIAAGEPGRDQHEARPRPRGQQMHHPRLAHFSPRPMAAC